MILPQQLLLHPHASTVKSSPSPHSQHHVRHVYNTTPACFTAALPSHIQCHAQHMPHSAASVINSAGIVPPQHATSTTGALSKMRRTQLVTTLCAASPSQQLPAVLNDDHTALQPDNSCSSSSGSSGVQGPGSKNWHWQTCERKQGEKGQVKRKHARKLALPRPNPQPRVWAAAARNAPLPGAPSWAHPAPPALKLLQSLKSFKKPMRVDTEPPPPAPLNRHGGNIAVMDIIRAARVVCATNNVKRGVAIGSGRTVGAHMGQGPVSSAAGRDGRATAASSMQPAAQTELRGPGMEGALPMQAEAQTGCERSHDGGAGSERATHEGESEAPTQWSGESYGLRGGNKGAKPSMSLEEMVEKAPIIVLNNALSILGSNGLISEMNALLKVLLQSDKENSHTWASAFGAFSDAGRPDLAIVLFHQACRKGTDIGPMGASALMKLCATQNNLDMGLELFYKMTSLRTTFNRYVYNCVLHLCGMHGRVYDGLDLLAAMRTDGAIQEDCTPDGYTYSALLKAITVAKKWELLPMVYKQMMRDRVEPDSEVWAQLVSLAGRANRTDLAAAYFNAAQSSKSPPSSHIYNAMLAAMARGGMDLERMMQLYQEMQSLSLVPDAYTYVPLFSALARAGSSLQEVDALALEMKTIGVQLNTQLGTALLNAYKHVPMASPETTQDIVTRVDDLLRQLVALRHANMQTYALAAAVHAQAGSLASVQRVLTEAVRARAPPDARALCSLSLACEDGGLGNAAAHFMDQSLAMKQAQVLAQQQWEGRRGALGR